MRLIDLLKEARKKEENLRINENLGSKANIRKRAKIIDQAKAREAKKYAKLIEKNKNKYATKLHKLIVSGKIDEAIKLVEKNKNLKKFLLTSLEAQGEKNILNRAKQISSLKKAFNNFKRFIEALKELESE